MQNKMILMNWMAKRKQKGYSAERELVNMLKELSVWATRIPVSAVGQPLPDVLAISKGVIHGFEIKVSSDSRRIYYRKAFDNLLEWLNAMYRENIDAIAWLAVKFRGKKWRFYRITTNTEKIKAEINFGLTFTQLMKILRSEEK